jgi:hypothetical protein
MKPRVYIETTIPSYLTAWPSRDPIQLALQQFTREWWDTRRESFELCGSQYLLDECGAGDPDASRLRLEAIRDIRLLELSADAVVLAAELMEVGKLPMKATLDASHIALVSVHRVPYLLTWNCRHIANAVFRRRFQMACERKGLTLPIICTPAELMEPKT